MTRFINRPEEIEVRETRVHLPHQASNPMFQGWGPKI
jgi:hypothetical protein